MRLAVCALVATACGRLSFDPVEDPPPGVTVGFVHQALLTDEAAGTVTIPLALSEPSADLVAVTFDATSGTATAGVDFTGSMSGTLMFAPGDTEASVVLSIAPDDVAETDETFDVTLRAPVNAGLGLDSCEITISANVLPRVAFVAEGSQGSEEGDAHVDVSLDIASTSQITVDYSLGGTATEGPDYTLQPGTITFAPGETTASIAINETNDALDEDTETVILTLHDPVNALLGARSGHDHQIIDNDDPPAVSFAVATSMVNENAGTITVNVNLSAPSGKTVTVKFDRGVNTLGAADATLAPDTLTFAPGVTTQSFEVGIVDDALDEDDEVLQLILEDGVNCSLGLSTATAITIADDDPPPTVGFAVASMSALESDGTVNVTVQLSAPSGRAITVPFTVSGTAGGNDFSLVTGSPLVFAPGDTTQTIAIAIVDDVVVEPSETIDLVISQPTNATLGVATTTLTIQDND